MKWYDYVLMGVAFFEFFVFIVVAFLLWAVAQ